MEQKAARVSLPVFAATALVAVACCLPAGAQELQPATPDIRGAAIVEKLPAVEIRISGTVVPTEGQARLERHLVPQPQSFHAAFGLGSADQAVRPGDVATVSLVAVQELSRRLASASERVQTLEAQVDALRFRSTLLIVLTAVIAGALVLTRPGRREDPEDPPAR